jgi:hypothetical protein
VRCGKVLVAVALILSIGAHWALLQSIAWIGMTVSYSQGASIATALEKTFDGKHPCPLCKLVKKGQATERNGHMLQLDTKFEFTVSADARVLYPMGRFPHLVGVDSFALARVDAPPLPPPRFA